MNETFKFSRAFDYEGQDSQSFFLLAKTSGLVQIDKDGLCIHQGVRPGDSVDLVEGGVFLAGGSLPFVPALVFGRDSLFLNFQTPAALNTTELGVARYPNEFLNNLYNYMLVDNNDNGLSVVTYSGPINPFAQTNF